MLRSATLLLLAASSLAAPHAFADKHRRLQSSGSGAAATPLSLADFAVVVPSPLPAAVSICLPPIGDSGDAIKGFVTGSLTSVASLRVLVFLGPSPTVLSDKSCGGSHKATTPCPDSATAVGWPVTAGSFTAMPWLAAGDEQASHVTIVVVDKLFASIFGDPAGGPVPAWMRLLATAVVDIDRVPGAGFTGPACAAFMLPSSSSQPQAPSPSNSPSSSPSASASATPPALDTPETPETPETPDEPITGRSTIKPARKSSGATSAAASIALGVVTTLALMFVSRSV